MLTDFLRVLTTMMREIKFLKGCHSSSLSLGVFTPVPRDGRSVARAAAAAAAAACVGPPSEARSCPAPYAAAVWATTN